MLNRSASKYNWECGVRFIGQQGIRWVIPLAELPLWSGLYIWEAPMACTWVIRNLWTFCSSDLKNQIYLLTEVAAAIHSGGCTLFFLLLMILDSKKESCFICGFKICFLWMLAVKDSQHIDCLRFASDHRSLTLLDPFDLLLRTLISGNRFDRE